MKLILNDTNFVCMTANKLEVFENYFLADGRMGAFQANFINYEGELPENFREGEYFQFIDGVFYEVNYGS